MHFTDLAIQIIADDKSRSAIERGEFDRLPGLGRPLHFDASNDPDWWIRRKLRDEGHVVASLRDAVAARRENESSPRRLFDRRD
jgi:hypothetical protein